MPPQDLPSYVGWVIEQKPELRDTPPEIKAEVQQELEARLQDEVNAALLAAVPHSELDHFENLLNHGSEKDVQRFCETNIPNAQELIAGVLVRFRNDYLGA